MRRRQALPGIIKALRAEGDTIVPNSDLPPRGETYVGEAVRR